MFCGFRRDPLNYWFPNFSNVPAAMHVAPFPFHLALIVYHCITLQEDWRENLKKEVQLDESVIEKSKETMVPRRNSFINWFDQLNFATASLLSERAVKEDRRKLCFQGLRKDWSESSVTKNLIKEF